MKFLEDIHRIFGHMSSIRENQTVYDPWAEVLSYLSSKDRASFACVSKGCREVVEKTQKIVLQLLPQLDGKKIKDSRLPFPNCLYILNSKLVLNRDSLNVDILRFPKLRELNLSDEEITDTQLTLLQYVTQLRTLNLKGAHLISKEGIKHVSVLSKLERLDLSDVPSIDRSTIKKVIKMCPNLYSLFVDRCGAVAGSLSLNVNRFKMLSFYGCAQITEIKFPKNAHNLQSLDLSGCNQINTLSFLEKTSRLSWLFLGGCTGIPSQHLRKIGDLSNILTRLDLSDCDIDDEFLPFIATCKKLSYLSLAFTRILDISPIVQNLKHLYALMLQGCRINNPELLKDLTNLGILKTPDRIGNHLEELIPSWGKLEKLNLSKIRQEHIELLTNLRRLKELGFWSSNLQRNDLSPLQKLQSLEILINNSIDVLQSFTIFPKLREYRLFDVKNTKIVVFTRNWFKGLTALERVFIHSRLLPVKSKRTTKIVLIALIAINVVIVIGSLIYYVSRRPSQISPVIGSAISAVGLLAIGFSYDHYFHDLLQNRFINWMESRS